jgi:hypothetical protein
MRQAQSTNGMDSPAVGQLEKTARDADEAFDRAWLASLQVDVVPHLGNPGIPPSALEHMAGILREGSRVHEFSVARSMSDGDAPSGLLVKPDRLDLPEQRSFDCATTRPGSLLPREAFSYSCFDLLFKVCSVSSTCALFIRRTRTRRLIVRSTRADLPSRCRIHYSRVARSLPHYARCLPRRRISSGRPAVLQVRRVYRGKVLASC